MAIKQLILEPPIAIDWYHRPISSTIKKEKKSKLLVLNDIYIRDALDDANDKKLSVIPTYSQKRISAFPEMLLTKEIIADKTRLKNLVKAYLAVDYEHKLSAGTLETFLELLYFASGKTSLGTTLKKWRVANQEQLAKYFNAIKLPKSADVERLKKSISIFVRPESYNFIQDLLKFLWKLHRNYASTKGSKKQASLWDNGTIIFIPASYLATNSYFQVIVFFSILNKFEVYLDSNVNIDPFDSYILNKSYSISLSRYANTDKAKLYLLAPMAENMLSTAQNPDQTLFIDWLSVKGQEALVQNSLADFQRLFSQVPITQFLGSYLRLNYDKQRHKQELGLLIYDIDNKCWRTTQFDVQFMINHLLPKHDSKKGNDLSANKKDEKTDSPNYEKTSKQLKFLSNQIEEMTENLNSGLTDLNSNFETIKNDIGKLTEVQKDQPQKAESSNKEAPSFDDSKIMEKLAEIEGKLNNFNLVFSELQETIKQQAESNKANKADHEYHDSTHSSLDDVERLNAEYEAALKNQNISHATDFDT